MMIVAPPRLQQTTSSPHSHILFKSWFYQILLFHSHSRCESTQVQVRAQTSAGRLRGVKIIHCINNGASFHLLSTTPCYLRSTNKVLSGSLKFPQNFPLVNIKRNIFTRILVKNNERLGGRDDDDDDDDDDDEKHNSGLIPPLCGSTLPCGCGRWFEFPCGCWCVSIPPCGFGCWFESSLEGDDDAENKKKHQEEEAEAEERRKEAEKRKQDDEELEADDDDEKNNSGLTPPPPPSLSPPAGGDDAKNKKKQQEEEDEAEEKRKEAEKRKQEDEELEADERRTEEERKRAEKQRKKEYAAWIAAEKLRLQIIYETTKEADLEELLTFCRQYHRDMISKVPAKGIARKGRSIADRSFWAGRGHYVSQRLAPPRETSPLRRNYREHLCRNLDASHRQQMEHATPWPTGSHDFPILITAPVFPLVIFFIGRINRRSEISSPSIEHPPERKPSRKSTPSNLGQNILPQTGSQQRIPTNTARTKN
ncbi:hypothetical protein Bca101_058564 [Brassica carinata]